MSGEFGSYENGYFHTQIRIGAQDCKEGECELTRLFGDFLKSFHPIARAISWSEAGDSAESSLIIRCVEDFPELEKRMDSIKKYLRVYAEIRDEALKMCAENLRTGSGS